LNRIDTRNTKSKSQSSESSANAQRPSAFIGGYQAEPEARRIRAKARSTKSKGQSKQARTNPNGESDTWPGQFKGQSAKVKLAATGRKSEFKYQSARGKMEEAGQPAADG